MKQAKWLVGFGLFLVSFTFAQYNEAPMLAEMVAAGSLPALEERLPSNPMVIEPLEQIGTPFI